MKSLLNKATLAAQLLPQMGRRYTLYRIRHAVDTTSGRLRRRFPVSPSLPQEANFQTLSSFRKNPPPFIFDTDELLVDKRKDASLAIRADEISKGTLTYFNAEKFNLDLTDAKCWVQHPLSHKEFPLDHWSDIPDLSETFGDIKYIWEPSRFSHVLTLIRDDYHNGTDRGAAVFQQIRSWLAANPINLGPNYKCSQEISLRLFNWTFALHYYRHHPALDNKLWEDIMCTIFWSIDHVYQHINFSRIAVRNNHAITETMLLWLSKHMFPGCAKFEEWSKKGKAWLEQELEYQIHEDGTYIQHSHNYQRVVVQLLSFGILMGELNGDALSPLAYERAKSMHSYLTHVMQADGRLPNYGANDGALFFPWASQAYRDYRPQLTALAAVLNVPARDTSHSEEAQWLSLSPNNKPTAFAKTKNSSTRSFSIGGIYTHQYDDTRVLLKAQQYRDRPSQCDNLHVELWIDGDNVLRDQGTYKYNTSRSDILYFNGCQGHNTVSIEGHSQFTKGPRFIWFGWQANAQGRWLSDTVWEGTIEGFEASGQCVQVCRKVDLQLAQRKMIVSDSVAASKAIKAWQQWWHPHPNWIDRLQFDVTDAHGKQLQPMHSPGYFSEYYGSRTEVEDLVFDTNAPSLTTIISWS